jgi:hypothetical protein
MTGKRDESTRKMGRPRTGADAYPTETVDALLVFGEPSVHPQSGVPCVRYPSIREIAKRFNVSHTTIAEYARRKNCVKRRQELQARTQAKAEQHMAETRAKSIAVTQADCGHMIGELFACFAEHLHEKKIRFDSVRDFAEIYRMHQAFIASTKVEGANLGSLSLEVLQRAHKEISAATSTVEERGELWVPPGAEAKAAGSVEAPATPPTQPPSEDTGRFRGSTLTHHENAPPLRVVE